MKKNSSRELIAWKSGCWGVFVFQCLLHWNWCFSCRCHILFEVYSMDNYPRLFGQLQVLNAVSVSGVQLLIWLRFYYPPGVCSWEAGPVLLISGCCLLGCGLAGLWADLWELVWAWCYCYTVWLREEAASARSCQPRASNHWFASGSAQRSYGPRGWRSPGLWWWICRRGVCISQRSGRCARKPCWSSQGTISRFWRSHHSTVLQSRPLPQPFWNSCWIAQGSDGSAQIAALSFPGANATRWLVCAKLCLSGHRWKTDRVADSPPSLADCSCSAEQPWWGSQRILTLPEMGSEWIWPRRSAALLDRWEHWLASKYCVRCASGFWNFICCYLIFALSCLLALGFGCWPW